MGLEVITNDKIKSLINSHKQVQNPNSREKEKGKFKECTYHLFDTDDHKFLLYSRQNIMKGMQDDFSCGIAWVMPSGERFTLKRYNGPSHNHLNAIEKERLGYKCHIHTASQSYIEEKGKEDGFAETTSRYRTLKGAMHCLVTDCNIHGLKTEPDQPDLFE